MIQTCHTHNLQFNDETIPACPECNPRSLADMVGEAKVEMRNICASCGEPFENNPRWWELHSNFCHDCVHGKLSAKKTKVKGRALKRATHQSRFEKLFILVFDKLPTGLELQKFTEWQIRRERLKKFIEKDGE